MKEFEMTNPVTSSSSATIVACGAVSAVLLISLAIAIIEAVAAIKRKFSYSSSTTVSSESKEETNGSTGHARMRQKKISLPEFTWLRHIRRCAKSSSQQGETNNNNNNCKNPSFRIVQDSLSNGKIPAESCVSRIDPREDADGCWSPVSHLRQMGAARFAATRRISTPVAPRKISNITTTTRKLSECPCSPSRHSMAVSNPTLPITPGVARLCSSLTDILEGHQTENHSLESDSSVGIPRNLLSLPDHRLEPAVPSTALEARLKRVRLIRHR